MQSKQKRYLSLDVIRGLALLGIAMLNALLIAYPQHFYMPLGFPRLSQIDKTVELGLILFVRTSFYPIFAFLFGAGFALQFSKTKNIQFFIRRYSFLLVVGMIHGILIWMGDILSIYALAAFILIFLARLSTRHKLLLVVVFTAISFVMINYGLQYVMQLLPLNLTLDELLNVYAQGNFWDVTNVRSYEFFYFGIIISLVYVLPQVLALFLFGMVAVEVGFFDYKCSSKKLFLVFGLLALLKLPRVYFAAFEESPALWRYVSVIFGGPALGGVYVLAVLVGLKGARANPALSIFAPVGRMALTNYLSQSIVLTSIFYGYGLGQYATWGSLDIVLLAVSLFVLQMIVSAFWLKHFRYGPLEWFWRCFSYQQWLSIR